MKKYQSKNMQALLKFVSQEKKVLHSQLKFIDAKISKFTKKLIALDKLSKSKAQIILLLFNIIYSFLKNNNNQLLKFQLSMKYKIVNIQVFVIYNLKAISLKKLFLYQMPQRIQVIKKQKKVRYFLSIYMYLLIYFFKKILGNSKLW